MSEIDQSTSTIGDKTTISINFNDSLLPTEKTTFDIQIHQVENSTTTENPNDKYLLQDFPITEQVLNDEELCSSELGIGYRVILLIIVFFGMIFLISIVFTRLAYLSLQEENMKCFYFFEIVGMIFLSFFIGMLIH